MQGMEAGGQAQGPKNGWAGLGGLVGLGLVISESITKIVEGIGGKGDLAEVFKVIATPATVATILIWGAARKRFIPWDRDSLRVTGRSSWALSASAVLVVAGGMAGIHGLAGC